MAINNVQKQIIKIVSNYGKLIKKNGISFDHVILFGSYANGLYKQSSDIDVCVVSKDLKDDFAMQVALGKLTWDLDTRIEPHPVSLSDYRNKTTPLINEVFKHGIMVS